MFGSVSNRFFSANNSVRIPFPKTTYSVLGAPKIWGRSNSGQDFSCSSDGQYMICNSENTVYVSHDYGDTWSDSSSAQIPPNSLMASCSMVGTGQYMCLAKQKSHIFINPNYGVSGNWVAVSVSLGAKNWLSVKISGSGSRIVAGGGPNVFYVGIPTLSTTPSVSWTAINLAVPATILGVSMSSDGRYQVSGGFLASPLNSGVIYRSSDYGATWTQKIDLNTVNTRITSSAMSLDGKIVAVILSGAIYKSSDFGDSWSTVSIPSSGSLSVQITMTADGKYQMYSASHIYASYDYGETFSIPAQYTLGDAKWAGMCISSDGKHGFAASRNTYIYPLRLNHNAYLTTIGNKLAYYSMNFVDTILIDGWNGHNGGIVGLAANSGNFQDNYGGCVAGPFSTSVYLTTPSIAFAPSNGLTFSFWLRSLATQASLCTLFEFDSTNGLSMQRIANTANYYVFGDSANTFSIPTTIWANVVVTINNANVYNVYVDGNPNAVLSNKVSVAKYPSAAEIGAGKIGIDKLNVTLGFNGYIDEFKIYNQIVSDETSLRALFNHADR